MTIESGQTIYLCDDLSLIFFFIGLISFFIGINLIEFILKKIKK
jgi:hypothetical protein